MYAVFTHSQDSVMFGIVDVASQDHSDSLMLVE